MPTTQFKLGEIPCILCQQYRHRVVIRENGYQGTKCTRCGLIYISPRPAWTDILALYLKTGENENLLEAQATGRLHNFIKSLPARHTLGILKKYCPAGTLLELGPGKGVFLVTAQNAGFEVSGLEVNQERAAYISQSLGIPCRDTPLSSSCRFENHYDVVYLRDVLSHFYDPVAQLRLLHEIIKKKGFLVFETGNLGEVDEKFFKFIPTFDYPEHLFFFGEQSLRLLLEKTGFELVARRRYAITFVSRLEKLVHYLKKQNFSANAAPKSCSTPEARSAKQAGLKQRLKNFLWLNYDFLVEYFFKYQLGRCLPRRGRSQTLIVIARRI